jgi:hypothetical protein
MFSRIAIGGSYDDLLHFPIAVTDFFKYGEREISTRRALTWRIFRQSLTERVSRRRRSEETARAADDRQHWPRLRAQSERRYEFSSPGG